MYRLARQFAPVALAIFVWAASPLSAQVATYGQPPTPKIVAYVLQALQSGDLASASGLVAQYRRLNGDTPEALEALSWLARGKLAAGNETGAIDDSKQIERSAQTSLATRKLDSEPHLPIALGAAYEVQAEALSKEGKRTQALQMLRHGLVTWKDTSLVDRLQKNINLLTLQGRPMPLLKETEWIGPKAAHPANWRGKPLLLFFWAHWCADCKSEVPILSKLAAEYEPRGLVVIAPTRVYGYTADDDHAAPAKERAFVERVFEKYYAAIPHVQAPLDSGNFQRFGASTTPTLLLVDRRGIVQLYHPGVMDEASLRAAIEPLLVPVTAKRAREQAVFAPAKREAAHVGR